MRVMTVVFLLAMFSGCRSFHPPDETTKHHSWGITEHRRNYFSFYSEKHVCQRWSREGLRVELPVQQPSQHR